MPNWELKSKREILRQGAHDMDDDEKTLSGLLEED